MVKVYICSFPFYCFCVIKCASLLMLRLLQCHPMQLNFCLQSLGLGSFYVNLSTVCWAIRPFPWIDNRASSNVRTQNTFITKSGCPQRPCMAPFQTAKDNMTSSLLSGSRNHLPKENGDYAPHPGIWVACVPHSRLAGQFLPEAHDGVKQHRFASVSRTEELQWVYRLPKANCPIRLAARNGQSPPMGHAGWVLGCP